MTEYEAVVVGGGIVGASVAYHLARDGVEALLVDRADEGRATDAGAGIVSPATSSRNDDPAWLELGRAAAAYYPDLAVALADEQDGPTGYAPADLLYVAVDEDEVEPWETAWSRATERADRHGYPDPDAIEEIPPDRARALFPPLEASRHVFRYRDAVRVDGRPFAEALVRAGEGHGLTVERGNVEAIHVEDGAVTAVAVDGDRVETDAAVVAGGAWSPAFGADLGLDLPISPLRGQIAHLDLGATATGDWPIVAGLRHHYLVPWPGGRVAVGATREDAGFEPRTTAAGVHEVLDEALRVAPGLADAELAEVRVGLRPVSADDRPVLGRVPGVDGAFCATGHGATGLQLGPYSGKLVADEVQGREAAIDLSAFRADRFA